MESNLAYGTGTPEEDLRKLSAAWWLLLLVGLLGIAAGIIVLAKPDISLATLAVIAGIFLLVDGIFEIAASLTRPAEARGLVAVLGVLSTIAGVILIRHPIAGVVAVALLIGIWLIAAGVVRLMEAVGMGRHRVWNLLVALLELVAGIVIVSSPDIGVRTLSVLVGIAFIVRGVAMCALAWAIRTLRRALTASP